MTKSKTFTQDPSRDQFFIRDDELLEKIASFASLSKEDTVLEVGTGDGRLTNALSKRCSKVITIEMDERLLPVLKKKFPAKGNVKVVFGNALSLLPGLFGKYDAIVSNPPYAISEPLVKALFSQGFREAILTLPSDFVSRLMASRKSREYSKLSLFFQAFFDAEELLPVPRDSFEPVPRTDSTVVRITPRKEYGRKEKMIRELALQDDRKLGNALREAFSRVMGKTKRQARSDVDSMHLPERTLKRKVSELSLADIELAISRMPGKYRLVCFDVDGTLVDEVLSIWRMVHKEMGIAQEKLDRASERYFRGEMSFGEWADHDIALWQERGVTKDDLLRISEKFRIMPGARETLEELKKRGLKLAVISGGLDVVLYKFFPDADSIFSHVTINRLSFNKDATIKGCSVPEEFGSGEKGHKCEHKSGVMRGIAQKEGVSLSECVFVGDAYNDIGVIQEAGLGIAFNATEDVNEAADVVITKKDMREILKYV